MTRAAEELYYFVHSAVKGICHEDVSVEVVESLPRSISLLVHHSKKDFPLIATRRKQLMTIMIAIAKKHGKLVNLALNE